MKRLLTALLGLGTFLVLATDASAGGYPGCNCYRPRPAVRQYSPPPPRPALVCQTLRMADADWAACQTKSWSLSSKDERIWTHSYRSQVIQVCRPAGHPNLGYRGKATGAQYVVRFQ
jgi:hypothetical protein